MKSLTVAILTYNRSRYLMEMLESVLSQTYTDFQVVVWDNASTDDTAELVRAVRDPRLTIHSHSENIGASNNANAAIQACRTDYLLLTHDDDRMKPEMLAHYMDVVNAREDLSLICCNADKIDQQGKVVQRAYLTAQYPGLGDRQTSGGGLAHDYIRGLNYIVCPTVLLSTNALRTSGVRFRADVGPAMDTFLWIELSFFPGKILFLNRVLYEYRVHRDQDSQVQASALNTRLRRPLFEFLRNRDRELARLWWQRSQPLVIGEWLDRTQTRGGNLKTYSYRLRRLWSIEDVGLVSKVVLLIKLTGSILNQGRKALFSPTPLKDLIKDTVATLQRVAFRNWGRILSAGIQRTTGIVLITGAPGFGGGPFTFLKFLLVQLQKRHRVVCSFREDEIRPELVTFCQEHAIELLSRPSVGRWRDLGTFAMIAKRVRPQAVVVNVGTFSQCFHLLALSLPILYYSHSIWHHSLPRSQAIFLPFFRYYLNHKIYTVSAAAKASLDQVYFSLPGTTSPVFWLHNGIQDRALGTATNPGAAVVLTLGSVAWYKNPELWRRVARKVVAEMPPGTVRFVWAGKGDLLERLSAENDNYIQFIGQVTQPDQLLSGCTLYFQPSQFESFGLGVCEAMMFAKPIVASNVGALPELISDGVEGYLVSLDQEDLMVKRLVSLLTNPTLAQSQGVSARERYLSRFTEVSWSQSFWSLWEKHFRD